MQGWSEKQTLFLPKIGKIIDTLSFYPKCNPFMITQVIIFPYIIVDVFLKQITLQPNYSKSEIFGEWDLFGKSVCIWLEMSAKMWKMVLQSQWCKMLKCGRNFLKLLHVKSYYRSVLKITLSISISEQKKKRRKEKEKKRCVSWVEKSAENREEFHAIILSQLFCSWKSRVQRTQHGGQRERWTR